MSLGILESLWSTVNYYRLFFKCVDGGTGTNLHLLFWSDYLFRDLEFQKHRLYIVLNIWNPWILNFLKKCDILVLFVKYANFIIFQIAMYHLLLCFLGIQLIVKKSKIYYYSLNIFIKKLCKDCFIALDISGTCHICQWHDDLYPLIL